MSEYQELVSAKYIQDEVVLEESQRGEGSRSRRECNQSAEGIMIWGFFAVAMCAIVLITSSTM